LEAQRYYPLLAIANLLAGGFLVVSVYGFNAQTTADLGLGVSIGVVLIGLAMTYWGFQLHDNTAMPLGAATTALGVWTIIASTVFEPKTAQWLIFANGLGHIGLSVTGLVLTEITRPVPRRRPASARSGRSRSRRR
jgi:hypothetical protein